jgi:hypothetical protein
MLLSMTGKKENQFLVDNTPKKKTFAAMAETEAVGSLACGFVILKGKKRQMTNVKTSLR